MTHNNAKFAFWYLLSLVALVFMAVSIGMIVFQIINQTVIDTLNNINMVSQQSLKFGLSALIIATPIFYWLTLMIRKALKKGDLLADAPIRRWLTYFILFVAAVVIIVWLVVIINSYLNGELTTKFILEAITVLAIAGVIFSYYFYDIRQGKTQSGAIIKIYLFGSLALVIGVFVASFFFVESPQVARDRLHDQNVVNDLTTLDGAISNYYNGNNKQLPAKLEALTAMSGSYDLPASAFVDEATGKQFDYKVVDNTHYQLCADFKVSSDVLSQNKTNYVDARWQHNAGHRCFDRQVEELLKDQPPVAPVAPVKN